MQTPSEEWAGSEPVLGELAAGLGVGVGWAAACCAACWAACFAACLAAFWAACFLASWAAASLARYLRRMVRAVSRTVRATITCCMWNIMSSLARLEVLPEVLLVTETTLSGDWAATAPGDPPDKNTKAAATPASVAAADTGTPTRRAGFLVVLGLE